jgi:ParB-like chromosome segregation protein Spo0J
MTKPQQAHLLGETSTEEDIDQRLRSAGLGPLPPRVLLSIPFERIAIPRVQTLNQQKVRDLVDSIKFFKRVLQPPSLGFEPGTTVVEAGHPDAQYRVTCGRHRVVADSIVAVEEGRETMDCFVYLAIFSPAMAASVSTAENFLRGEDWRYEVAQIKELIRDKIPLTEQELSKRLGLKRPLVRQRMAIARLLDPLVEQVTSDKKISLGLATRMAKMTPAHQQHLVARLVEGSLLTEDLINEVWREQTEGDLEQTAPTFLQVLDLKVDGQGCVIDETNTSRGSAPRGEASVHLGTAERDEENPVAVITEILPLIARLKQFSMPPRLSGLSEFYKQALESWLHDLQKG